MKKKQATTEEKQIRISKEAHEILKAKSKDTGRKIGVMSDRLIKAANENHPELFLI